MSLEEKINLDIRNAMMAKEKERLEALRAIKAAILIEKTGKYAGAGHLPEDAEMVLLQKLIRQRKDSAVIYSEQGRKDLADAEEFQAGIISEYLPEQMTEEQIRHKILEIITVTGATGMKDMGRVMGSATHEMSGKAENKLIAEIVREMLSGLG
ncbi:MAG: GatB/YqeY domain-containing protein [Bacteroidales bacterium]|nr:GatB/YqeY domain-containing protein [Bacteroidales bacterium]